MIFKKRLSTKCMILTSRFTLASHMECGNSTFSRKYNPRVLIIDIPYQENWEYIKRLRRLKEPERRGFIAWTTNKQRLLDTSKEILIFNKPFDLDNVINAAKKFT